MSNFLPKNKLLVLSAILLVSAAAGVLFFPNQKAEAGSGDNLSGWAWSENVGWISMNSTNENSSPSYGVNVDNTGLMSGYAWSENIGWISFNSSDLAGCPSGQCAAQVNTWSGAVSGWAKALAADNNGWDGWIHLAGNGYGITANGCVWDGYAWGSDVIGWIHFKGTNYGVTGSGSACVTVYPALSFSCSVSPTSASAGSNVTWSAAPSGGTGNYNFNWIGDSSLNGQITNPVNISYTSIGTKSGSLTVTSGGQSAGPQSCGSVNISPGIVSFTANPSTINKSQSSTLAWQTTGFSSCVLTNDKGKILYTSPNASDSYKVTPNQTTTYTLTCDNSASSQATVTVSKSPAFKEIKPE